MRFSHSRCQLSAAVRTSRPVLGGGGGGSRPRSALQAIDLWARICVRGALSVSPRLGQTANTVFWINEEIWGRPSSRRLFSESNRWIGSQGAGGLHQSPSLAGRDVWMPGVEPLCQFIKNLRHLTSCLISLRLFLS